MNINRDYLIINDVKKSNIKLDNGSMFFYITDKNTQNIFVNLVINISNNDLIQKYANIENAEDYTLTMNIVKPDNTYKIIEGKLHDKENAIFEFDLKEDCVDKVGTYRCELLTKCNINDHEEITTSNKLTYKVKASVLNDLDDIVEAPEYPLVIQLFDKLSDIEQYEEDRRANELARQLAEEQRQTRFNELNADIDNKMVDVENRISAKEEAVDTLITDTKADIDEYKVAKDQEIDEYKATKDTEINNAITAQDNKIDIAISNQNDRIVVVENNVVAQNDRLDVLENKDTLHESKLEAIEAKNTEQDNRLDIAENRLANIGNDITNTMQPIIDGHTSRLEAIEAIDVVQNNRLDAIEVKNQEQDDRLLDIEKVNNRQDIDIKCLYGASQTIDVTKEGNSIYLQNSNDGFAVVDEIKGNTLVNCNKEPDKELILNGNINTSGDNAVTITEGVDGGLVDVALEGNTLVNVSNTKDSTALPLEEELTYLYANTQYTVQFISTKAITADITLGGAQLLAQSIVAGLNRISITTPATLANNKLIISGVGTNIMEVIVTNIDRELIYFEGMKSVGEGEELQVISVNSDSSKLNTQQLTHEPLRAAGDVKDRYVLIDGKWYIERNVGLLDCTKIGAWSIGKGGEFYRNGFLNDIKTEFSNDISDHCKFSCNTYPVGKIGDESKGLRQVVIYNHGNSTLGQIRIIEPSCSTVDEFYTYMQNNPTYVTYPKNTTYEPIDYNPFEVYSEVTHITTNSTIPCNVTVKNHGFNCLLKPNTTYTVSSNLGLNTVTTPSVLTEDCLRFMDTDTSDVTTMKNVTVLEGDYTTGKPLPSHFSGIESCFEQEYDEAVGKYKVKIRIQNEDASKENYIEFYINEPLRGIGDVKDKVYVKNDKVIVERNCACVTFDGSDDEKFMFSYESTYNLRFRTYSGEYVGVPYICKSNNFNNKNTGSMTHEGFNNPNNNIEFVISKLKLSTQDVAGFKQWLQQNPVTVVYQLAEPTYEEVEYNDVKLFIESFKNSTLFYNSNVAVSSKLYYSYSVPLVDTVAKTANVTDQQDSMIIDLATQCAVMEMMLM